MKSPIADDRFAFCVAESRKSRQVGGKKTGLEIGSSVIRKRISSSIGFQPVSKTYTANSLNQYTAVGSQTPIHDLDGNLTNEGDWEYIWNGEFAFGKANRMPLASRRERTRGCPPGSEPNQNRLVEARKIHPVNAYEMRLTYKYDGARQCVDGAQQARPTEWEGLGLRVPSGRKPEHFQGRRYDGARKRGDGKPGKACPMAHYSTSKIRPEGPLVRVPSGRKRGQKRVWEFNGSAWIPQQRHTFVWQGWNLIYEEIEDETTSTTSTRRFTWGLDLSGSAQGAGGVGGLLAVDDEGANVEGLYFYDANPVFVGTSGSHVGQVVDSSTGTILAHYEYSPFGETITSTGSYAEINPFRFSTKYLDEDLGWYYYGFRYYDPETGRWPNRDPIEEEGGLNLYGFVGNDGVNAWDVLGLSLGIATAARRNSGTVIPALWNTITSFIPSTPNPSVNVKWSTTVFTAIVANLSISGSIKGSVKECCKGNGETGVMFEGSIGIGGGAGLGLGLAKTDWRNPNASNKHKRSNSGQISSNSAIPPCKESGFDEFEFIVSVGASGAFFIGGSVSSDIYKCNIMLDCDFTLNEGLSTSLILGFGASADISLTGQQSGKYIIE